jgi:hypothetical protein
MSTITMNYPDVIRVRRAQALGRILILSSFVLIAITTLIMVTSAQADLTNRATIPQNSISPVPVPVSTAPTTNIQPVLSEIPTPSAGLASEPSVMPVPVPTPPSQ